MELKMKINLLFIIPLILGKRIVTEPRPAGGCAPGAIETPLHCFHVADLATDGEEDSVVRTHWNLDRIDQPRLPLDNRAFAPAFNGSGVEIHIVDTGVSEHAEFGGRVVERVSFNGSPVDGHGHGTHVAGIAAGSSSGVARGADIVSVKVLGDGGTGSVSDVIEGIAWSIRRCRGRACVLSMSMGGGKSPALDTAVRDAHASGMAVVTSAGNSAKDACAYSPAGAGGGVVAVQSTTRMDFRSSFSNFGPCTSIAAPGTSVRSTWLGGSYRTLSGTSMAAPHVSGALALMLQKHGGDRDRALAELFTLAVPMVVPEVPLLQVPAGGGAVTPYPTLPPFELRLCSAVDCMEFRHALFGPSELQLAAEPVQGQLYFNPGDGCDEARVDRKMQGRVVVTERGGCEFFTKTKQAQRNGALALLISTSGDLFPPRYYGSRSTKLHAAMVPWQKVAGVKHVFWGIRETPPPTADALTPRPTPPGRFVCYTRSRRRSA